MRAILTRYYGATNTRGARIVASAGDRVRLSVPYEHAGHPHTAAAVALCRKMKWTGELTAGQLPNGGYVFVFVDRDALVSVR